jgi:hypothetical protein
MSAGCERSIEDLRPLLEPAGLRVGSGIVVDHKGRMRPRRSQPVRPRSPMTSKKATTAGCQSRSSNEPGRRGQFRAQFGPLDIRGRVLVVSLMYAINASFRHHRPGHGTIELTRTAAPRRRYPRFQLTLSESDGTGRPVRHGRQGGIRWPTLMPPRTASGTHRRHRQGEQQGTVDHRRCGRCTGGAHQPRCSGSDQE